MKTKKKTKNPSLLVADDVGTDPSHERRSRAVIGFATELAKRLETGIDIIHVEDLLMYPVNRSYYKPMIKRYMSDQKERLSRVAESGEVKTRSFFLNGYPVDKILEMTRRQSPRYEVLALGTHGRKGIGRLVMGSVAEEIIRNARIPVMTIGPAAQESFRPGDRGGHFKILVATDLGANSLKCESYALSVAKRIGAEIVLFHSLYEGLHPVLQTAFSVPTPPREVDDWLQELKAAALKKLEKKCAQLRKAGVSCSLSLNSAPQTASEGVLQEIERQSPDVVMMGTHGRSLVSGAFFGSTARKMILEAPVPVFTVRSRS